MKNDMRNEIFSIAYNIFIALRTNAVLFVMSLGKAMGVVC